MDLNAFGSALGALGLGSLLGQYLTQGRDRRTTRTDVLAALEACETARWAPDETNGAALTTATRQLESAAVISGLPPRPVDQYIFLAWAAYWTSLNDEELAEMEGRDPEHWGAIPTVLADHVSDAGRDVALLVWSPWRGRLLARRAVAARARRTEELIAQGRGAGDSREAAMARYLERARERKARYLR